jgi:hypothetical protein
LGSRPQRADRHGLGCWQKGHRVMAPPCYPKRTRHGRGDPGL